MKPDLDIKGGGFIENGASNCLGYAILGSEDTALYPAADQKLKDFINNYAGNNCKNINSVKQCSCECDEIKIIFTFRGKVPEDINKNVWELEAGKAQYGFHSYRASGCSGNYTNIGSYKPYSQNPYGEDPSFHEGKPMKCCCMKKD